MQFNTRASASVRERELLHQFGIEEELQIKICKLKFYTFKAVAGKQRRNKLEPLSAKLAELPSAQINTGHCIKKTNRLKCSQCSYVGKYPSCLKRHTFKHLVGKPKPFKCEWCEYSVGNKTDLVKHIRTHTGEKPFKCALCIRNFVTKSKLNRHIRTHTGEKFHQCQFCKKQFLENSDKNTHEKICKINPKQADEKWVETQKKFKCTICSYSVISKWRLQLHLKTHTDKKEFECKLCSSKYKSYSGLRYHILTHNGRRAFPCQFCKKSFAELRSMNFHKRNCKLNPKTSAKEYVEMLKTFKCHECSRSFRKKGDLTQHLSVHTGEKRLACTLCTYKCRTKRELNVHIRTHTKEKPFKCPHYNFTSGEQSNLKKHVNARHFEGVRQKNFSCEICSRSYFTKQDLRLHVRTHTGERLHACQYCKKGFLRKGRKDQHERICKF